MAENLERRLIATLTSMACIGTFRAVRFGALHRNKLPFRDPVVRIFEEERRAIGDSPAEGGCR